MGVETTADASIQQSASSGHYESGTYESSQSTTKALLKVKYPRYPSVRGSRVWIMEIWKVVVRREPGWRVENALLKWVKDGSDTKPWQLRRGLFPPLLGLIFPQEKGLMHSRPSMSLSRAIHSR